ncbi:peptidylprolyl isomerase [Leptobacterium sp. I13]|uniref:peptidylprolyl isomerase n=1 Tax=Leptobacterium meishanense TaxID=3128904 RepID=UPI0030ED0B71
MKNIKFLALILIAIFTGCKTMNYRDLGEGLFADIQTNKGAIVVKLTYKATPVTVANFVTLAEGNNPGVSDEYKEKPYYDGVIFHRVIKDFMIQGGDPTGTGRGTPGYRFDDEIVDSLVHDKPGILSMANAGPNTNGSQFFITHKPTPFLNGKHAVFGEVVKGLEVVDSIANVKTSQDRATKDRPIEDVVMNKVIIVRNGKEAKKFDAVKVMTDYFEAVHEKEEAIKKAKEAFLNELASQKNEATVLPSGLKVYKLIEGQGEKPKTGQTVLVNYAGFLADGTLFDTSEKKVAEKHHSFEKLSRQRGGSFEPIGMLYSPEARLIAGFKEGLMTMNVGDKIRLFIPPHLGYGPAGAGDIIPPNAELIFDLEIIEIQ